MEFNMKNWVRIGMLIYATSLVANHPSTFSDDFAEYHLSATVEDEDVFYLIQKNIDNLKNAGTSDDPANELINLMEEGYKIDPVNMIKLIETLQWANASNNAKEVIIMAIEYHSPITTEHMIDLIQTLAHANASDNAAAIVLKAIEYGVPFGPKERLMLAEVSEAANARSNVERIRQALHERAFTS